jgi:uncharacterized protein YkwD
VTTRRGLLLLALLALLAAPAALAQRGAVQATSVQALDAGVLTRLNEIRAAHGLVPLKLNAALTTAALGHSSEMLADGYFAHESHDGAPFWKRLGRYTGPGGGWTAGENLLWSSPGVEAGKALELWMGSPEHRRNILSPGWREIGIAALHAPSAPGVYGGMPVTVITTDFGARASS